MERPHVLVVCYSLTGHAKRVAEALARALGADLEELRDRADRTGLLGYLRCCAEVLLGASAEIDRPRRDPARYDLVVVGGPVWGSSVSSPVRTYLWLERDRLPSVAFFTTLGGMGAERAFGQMAAVARRRPVGTLAVREGELASAATPARIAAFAAAVARAAGRRRARRSRAAPRAAA